MKKIKMTLSDVWKLKGPLENFLKLPIPIDVSWKFGKIAKKVLDEWEGIEGERKRTVKRFLEPEEDSFEHVPVRDRSGNLLPDQELIKANKINEDKDRRRDAFKVEFTNLLETEHTEFRFEPINLSDPRIKDMLFSSSNMIILHNFFEE